MAATCECYLLEKPIYAPASCPALTLWREGKL